MALQWHNNAYAVCYAMAENRFGPGQSRVFPPYSSDKTMITPEQSRATRARLGLSQRHTAEQAAVPRSYLNQFERGRWIPTDEFSAKLLAFYVDQGLPDPATLDAPDDDSLDNSSTFSADVSASPPVVRSQWAAVSKAALVVGAVGGILIASGNVPAALALLRRVREGRQRI